MNNEISKILDYLTIDATITETTNGTWHLDIDTWTDDIDDAQDLLVFIREDLEDLGYELHNIQTEHDHVSGDLVRVKIMEYENGIPILTPPPNEGNISLPNGCTLFWKMTEQGREYISDEIGGGVQVWHTALVDQSTLLAAIVQEQTFQKLESEIENQKKAKAYDSLKDKIFNLVDFKNV